MLIIVFTKEIWKYLKKVLAFSQEKFICGIMVKKPGGLLWKKL
ncbi:hypothetical protein CHY_0111 [Carboxydothermus hydrogenoformans Z-2901]|uniref:Uncharacterized protein n=1 Tax=Carboxydothermus hydrogenoformans (strain ATCC BAA-161 / DSM 6008 / Z-2901) TaxID=246194 RepID=Q3AFV1_CARHZ|nr:hypothetical protein CHY_0111 [Carboxydothermus hydrogenoformans Z-2901]